MNVKEAYTNQDWANRESYYVQEVGKINLPTDPNSKDIMRIVAEIDGLLSEATLECSYLRRKFQDLETKMKLSEKETFIILKQQNNAPTGAGAPAKLTESDVKGLVVKYLRSNPIHGMKSDIYTVLQSVEYRLVFIEAVVKMLTDKKMSIFADKAMIAIEAGMGGGNNNQP